MRFYGLTTDLPVYVTRKNADGETGTLYVWAWMPLLVAFLAWLNVVVWGCIGLYEAARVFV